MPNSCVNLLHIYSKNNPESRLKLKKLYKSLDKTKLLNCLLPPPKNLTEKETIAWQKENWGVKWDVISTGNINFTNGENSSYMLDVVFETANNEPYKVYEHLMTLGFFVKAWFVDVNNEYFGEFNSDREDKIRLFESNDHMPNEINFLISL